MILKLIRGNKEEVNGKIAPAIIPVIEYLDYICNIESNDGWLKIYTPKVTGRDVCDIDTSLYSDIFIMNDEGKTIERIK